MKDLRRKWAFARHIPPAQIMARGRLALKRRLSLRTRPILAPVVSASAAPPLPLMPGRADMIETTRTGWRFSFLGRRIDMPRLIDWRAPGSGPENQLWRMNLHYMEYLEQLDPEAGIDLICQWISANPPWQPGYWHDSWNSYALSLRVVVWMQRMAEWRLVANNPALHRINASLAEQIAFLSHNMELDIGGNHLIKNIKALVWGSAYFSGAPATQWRKTALRLLSSELRRQILPDGVHYERSPSYHAQVFADLLEIRHVLGGAGAAMDSHLARMARATALLKLGDGKAAMFNDAGLSMAYTPAQCIAAYATVTGLSPSDAQGGFALESSGYYGFHGKIYSLVTDFGAIGPNDLPAHAHADMGSFELSVKDKRIIVDQGVYEYVAGDKRQQSRAAANHNSFVLHDAEPADFFGAFRCGRRPQVTVLRRLASDTGLLVEGTHTGYAPLPGRPMPIRTVVASDEDIIITDKLSARQWHPCTLSMLLHPDCSATLTPNGAIVKRGRIKVEIVTLHRLTLEPAVWWPDMGVELKTQRLRLTLPESCFVSSCRLRIAAPKSTGKS